MTLTQDINRNRAPTFCSASLLLMLFMLLLTARLSAQTELELLESYLSEDTLTGQKALELYDRIMGMERFTEGDALEEMLNLFPELYDVREAARIFDAIGATNDPQKLGFLFLEVGNIHQKKGRPDQALQFYQQAIPELSQTPLGSEMLPGLQMKLGQIYESQTDYQQAQRAYQAALQALSVDFSASDIFVFPPADAFIAPIRALPILAAKARVFSQQYKGKKEPLQLEGALQAYEKSIDLVRHVRPRYPSENDQLRLSSQLLPIHEKAISTASRLDQLTPGKSYLERAFLIAEKAKGNVLLQALISRQYLEEGGIDPALLKKESALKSRLAFYKNHPESSADSIDILEEQLYDLQETMAPFLTEKIPDLPLAQISEVQALLPTKKSVFVDFFLGYDHLFVFTITHDAYYMHQIPQPATLLQEVSRLKREISTNHFEYEPKIAFQQYTRAAYLIYRKLLEEAVFANLSFAPDHLILSPDDQLWTIPFEVLLTREVRLDQPNYHPEVLDYLFETCSISYANSATLFVYKGADQKGQQISPSLAAFAPDFNQGTPENRRGGCSALGLAKLNYNQEEAQKVAQTFKGTTFLGNAATKEEFAKAAQSYQLIHLATHACINDDDPLDNRIFFADGDLAVYEVYQMNFQSKLVVLSACETGVGTIHQGEGVLSLARGFVQANCPNVVMSLWEVADQATAVLMEEFYKQLEGGLSQSQALRAAKLEFLRKQDRTFTHPYYWAGFVHLGRDQVFDQPTSLPYWLWLLIPVIILWGAWWLLTQKMT